MSWGRRNGRPGRPSDEISAQMTLFLDSALADPYNDRVDEFANYLDERYPNSRGEISRAFRSYMDSQRQQMRLAAVPPSGLPGYALGRQWVHTVENIHQDENEPRILGEMIGLAVHLFEQLAQVNPGNYLDWVALKLP